MMEVLGKGRLCHSQTVGRVLSHKVTSHQRLKDREIEMTMTWAQGSGYEWNGTMIRSHQGSGPTLTLSSNEVELPGHLEIHVTGRVGDNTGRVLKVKIQDL